ncbi:hypothetical protein ILUMI_26311 [Ignelater luminosus]|uniref:CHK kinase-like domain-containing protein n=1 Tax=Ignelater luminosus TaxID=2038154 RepID=A0A8K0FZ84_IGNLU|nr:hypothetical protein ILUMI_26311 [Ignelater luminosus]
MYQKNVDFTENDCKIVLGKYYGDKPVKLINFKLAPISDEINGFMGEHLRLKLEVVNEANETEIIQFFVKTIIAEQEVMAEFTRAGDMFNKEIYWYEFLNDVKQECPDVDISFSPKYYCSRENDFIVLEDLCLSGCKMPQGFILDKDHLKMALKSIAKYHTASIIYEEVKSKKLGRRYSLLEDYGKYLQESMYRKDENYLGYKYIRCALKALQTLVDLLPEVGLTSEEFKERLEILTDQAFEDSKPSSIFRNVWSNGDLWAKNIMFKYENDVLINCKVFDFQLQRYNPPAHDAVFMVYESTTKCERRRYSKQYLAYYYQELSSELGKFGLDINNIVNKEDFNKSCKLAMPVIKLSKTLYRSLHAMSEETYRKITREPDLYAKLTFEDRTEFVTNLFKTEKCYKEEMTTLLEDLRDLLINKNIAPEFTTVEYNLAEF